MIAQLLLESELPESNSNRLQSERARMATKKRQPKGCQPDSLEERFSSVFGRKTKGAVVGQLEEEISRVFSGTAVTAKPVIEVEAAVPTICKNPKELREDQKVTLRTSMQTILSQNVELKQFDPNFFSRENIWCRYPGCKQRRPRQRKFKGSKPQKEDLYLCARHRTNLEDYVAKMCAQKGVGDISTKNIRSEDLEGYTSIIGLLENGYHSLTKPQGPSSGRKHTAILQEICLNMRNYLVIVNALLNPLPENLITSLKAVFSVFNETLKILRDDGEHILETLRGMVDLLREVIELILFTFGIIYSWVYLSLMSNPGAQLGAGIGGLIGMVGYGVGGPLIGTLTAACGAVFGGLIGSGVYNLWGPQHTVRLRAYQEFAQSCNRGLGEADQQLQTMPDEEPAEDERPVYYLTGSANGDFVLAILSICTIFL